MNNALLIHNDNTSFKETIRNKILFNPTIDDLINGDIDKYISKNIISHIKIKKFEIIFIKDNLSSNYIDFHGLRLAYHIRFEFGQKSFIPIVIISDIDASTINRLTSLGAILFTKHVYLIENSSNDINNFRIFEKREISFNKYQKEFLNKIKIEPPKDYLSHHDISNEWAIYRWAEFLNIKDSKAINQNREKISSMLYFKYLLAKNPVPKKNGIQFVSQLPKNSGKILYIDDEWAKGWSDIFRFYFSKNPNIKFDSFKYNFKDNNKFKIISDIEKKIKKYNPDLVILDLRLTKSDHNKNQEIEKLTGIIISKSIKELNPAIQIIILSATSKSTILENLYKYNILGYIKKEHPTDINISTKDNFNKLKDLVDRGLEKSYLKEIWEIQNSILAFDILKQNRFRQMRFEINSIFEILDSNMKKRYIYAMLSIHQCLEHINNYFIDDSNGTWKDTGYNINVNTSTKNKILKILEERLHLTTLNSQIYEITSKRNRVIHPHRNIISIDSSQIVLWFKMLQEILKKVSDDKPNS